MEKRPALPPVERGRVGKPSRDWSCEHEEGLRRKRSKLHDEEDSNKCDYDVIDLTGSTPPPSETASDRLLAQLLQQELNGTPSCHVTSPSAHVGLSNDFEIARQLQQELDSEAGSVHQQQQQGGPQSRLPGAEEEEEEEGGELSYERLLDLSDVKTGLDTHDIDRLTITYKFSSSSSTAERKCCICLQEFAEGGAVCSLPCTHSFHSRCVKQWLSDSKSCPVCMKDITELAT